MGEPCALQGLNSHMRGVSARQEDPALPHLDAILMPSQGRGKEKAQWIHFTSPQEETS